MAAARTALLLLLGAFAFHVLGAWSLPLLDRDEPRFAEASREMLERGDYVVPRFNGEERFDKPPLAYWLQVASFRAFGESDLAARLPSVLAAALTTVVTFAFGRRLYGPLAGLWAALLLTVSFQMVVHGKAAVADMPMVLAFAVALWAGWEGARGRERRWWFLLAAALALGFLAKGPVIWLALVPVLILAARSGPGRGRLLVWSALAFLLSLAAVAAWAWPAIERTDGRYLEVGLGRHVVGRSFAAMEGHGGGGWLAYLAFLPFYGITLFPTFLPGSVFLPWLVRRLWRREPGDRASSYLLCAVLAVLLVFTFVSTKLPHYILPAFPALALLLAGHWTAAGRPVARLGRGIAIAGAVWVAVALVGFPLCARFFPSRELARRALPLAPETLLGTAGYTEPSVVWYFRAQISGYAQKLDPAGVEAFLAGRGPRAAVLLTEDAGRLGLLGREELRRFSVRGINVAKARIVEVTVLIKD